MIVELIWIDLLACVQMKFAVQGMLIRLSLLEELHTRGLLHPALEYAAHAFHRTLSKLIRFAAIVVDASVGLIQTPNGRSTVDTVTH